MSRVGVTLVANSEALLNGGPGTIRFDNNAEGQPARMPFKCPCGCGIVAGVSLKPANPNGWEWNGSKDKPTLSPSVLIKDGDGEHWHGWLRDGIWESC